MASTRNDDNDKDKKASENKVAPSDIPRPLSLNVEPSASVSQIASPIPTSPTLSSPPPAPTLSSPTPSAPTPSSASLASSPSGESKTEKKSRGLPSLKSLFSSNKKKQQQDVARPTPVASKMTPLQSG